LCLTQTYNDRNATTKINTWAMRLRTR
jgi:hypothetical protein